VQHARFSPLITEGLKMRIVGFIATMALIVLGIQAGSTLSAFYDATAILIVIGAMIGGFFIAAGSETGQALKAAFSSTETGLHAGLHGLRGGRMGALVGGFLSVLIGLIDVLNNHDDPAAFGPGLALTILGFLWGVFLSYAILLPLQAGIEQRLMNAESETIAPSDTALDLLIFGSGLLICSSFYVILKAAFSV